MLNHDIIIVPYQHVVSVGFLCNEILAIPLTIPFIMEFHFNILALTLP